MDGMNHGNVEIARLADVLGFILRLRSMWSDGLKLLPSGTMEIGRIGKMRGDNIEDRHRLVHAEVERRQLKAGAIVFTIRSAWVARMCGQTWFYGLYSEWSLRSPGG
jgi:hypothetical protein